jgi:hypothetical protein
MTDNNPQKPGEHAALLSVGDPRSVQAIINKVADGYTVTVSLKKDGRIRAEADSAVDTFADAETVARTFASQQDFPWYKVAVVLK